MLVIVFFISLFPIYSYNYNLEKPYSIASITEKPSPSNWVKENQIRVYDNKVIIELEGAEWAKFTDTHSMEPAIDADSNALEIVPKNYTDIQLGDIISYEVPEINGTIIHRVIETGFDANGWYAITKGDNVPDPDPFKLRFENIKRVVVAIIY